AACWSGRTHCARCSTTRTPRCSGSLLARRRNWNFCPRPRPSPTCRSFILLTRSNCPRNSPVWNGRRRADGARLCLLARQLPCEKLNHSFKMRLSHISSWRSGVPGGLNQNCDLDEKLRVTSTGPRVAPLADDVRFGCGLRGARGHGRGRIGCDRLDRRFRRGSIEQAVANVLKRWDPAIIFTTGDNNYPGGLASTIDVNIGQFFHDYIQPYVGTYGDGASSNRFFPCLGNHDWVSNGQPHIDYFTLPGNERYYSYRYGPVEIFIINSNADADGTASTSVQGRWLQNAMAVSTARWKLVSLHHPPYSADVAGAGTPGMRWPYAAWGAAAVFAGHEHVYARIHTNGIVYFINGLGGDSIGGFSGASAAAVRYNGDYGAMRLEATDTNLIFQFITRGNVVVDTHVLGAPIWSPFILSPPLSQTALAGRNITFDVLATSTGALRYQWLFNSVAIANATNRVLTLANV